MFRSLTQIILAVISLTKWHLQIGHFGSCSRDGRRAQDGIVLKVDDLVGDVTVAVSELNSNICKNNQPKVDFRPALNYSLHTSHDCHVTFKYVIENKE